MNTASSLTGLALTLATMATTVVAEDFDVETYINDPDGCSRCHDSSVYTRPDRKVTSLQSLDAQVRRCDSMLETKLFEDDIGAIVAYLNQHYYKF